MHHLVQGMHKINTDIGESASDVFRKLQTENEQVICYHHMSLHVSYGAYPRLWPFSNTPPLPPSN